jgi:Uma2 family endonuclease
LVTHLRPAGGIVGRAELHSFRRAEQNMGMPATTQRWTRDEVLDLIARNPLTTPRYELVDGELLVTPSPSGPHQFAVALMLELLRAYLAGEPGVGEALTSPADVMLEDGTTVGPDVFVVPPAEANRILHEMPVRELVLAVEVLSPGDRSGDRSRKRRLYQRHVPEYWIVDTSARVIEAWRPGAATAVVHRERLEWQPPPPGAGAGETPPSRSRQAYRTRRRG